MIRVLVGIAAPLFVLLGCRWLLHGGGLVCLLYELTGLYCPGCGSGRAVYSALHGRLAESFRYNPALYILGIPAMYVVLHEYLRLVFPRLGLRPVYVPRGVVAGVTAALVLWWIVRNLPMFSFLAPAG